MKTAFLTLLITLGTSCSYSQDIPLSPCPKTPNCICSFEAKVKKNLSPLPFKGNRQNSIESIKILLSDMKGANLTEETEHYLHYEFETTVGHFIDDVEFYFNEKDKIIHFRSASRVGYSDMGANKRRMKKIKKSWDSN